MATERSPSIIFIDEIDGLAVDRGGGLDQQSWERKIVNQLLIEMSRLEVNETSNVLVLGASNMPWLIDRSLLRAGRFSNWVFIKEPEKEERISLFQHYLKGIPSSGVLDFHVLASRTGNFSTSRIKKVCDDTCQKLFDKSIDNDSVEFITQGIDFYKGSIGFSKNLV